MTELLILDSSAIIALFDGNTAAARLLGDATRILVPATVWRRSSWNRVLT